MTGTFLNPADPVAPPDAIGTRSLSLLAAPAAAVAAATGLLVTGAYDAPAATTEMLRGYDLVTLLLVVPGLLLTRRDRPGREHVLRLGLLAYLVYTYLFASVTGGLGAGFLLDVTVLALATFALGLALATTDAGSLRVRRPGPSRVASVMLGVLALGLGGMWLVAALTSAVTGGPPAGSVLVESDVVVRLGIVLDLALLVPSYALAAVLLWRGTGWGAVLGGLAVVSGLLHQVSYLVAMPFQVVADVPGAAWTDPFEPVIVAAYVVGLVSLLKGWSSR